jgi:hypothetical protein
VAVVVDVCGGKASGSCLPEGFHRDDRFAGSQALRKFAHTLPEADVHWVEEILPRSRPPKPRENGWDGIGLLEGVGVALQEFIRGEVFRAIDDMVGIVDGPVT